MRILYTFSILLYGLLIRIASLFNTKAKLLLRGRKGWRHYLRNRLQEPKPTFWFHCASLGEFEQGRPLMERLRRDYPHYRILLTFFSPSGYEVRKNYTGADVVCYLPLDSPWNARDFVEIVKPEAAFIIKYEFWFNILHQLHRHNIPHYLISGIFREKQHFFKWWGGWSRKALAHFSYLFTQDENSLRLLQNIGIQHAAISGDTRFDRVSEIAQQAKAIPIAQHFVSNAPKTLVAGSTWPADEQYLFPALATQIHDNWKLILAPHELGEAHITAIEKGLCEHGGLDAEAVVRFSNADETTISQARVLIIDNMGMLSSLYQYGQLAYIGGGFGKAVHNTLEAAVWNIPLVCGPAHQKFQEIQGLIASGGLIAVDSEETLKKELNIVLNSSAEELAGMGQKAGHYVQQNIGATEKIMRVIATKINR